MKPINTSVGLDRRIRLEWLEFAVRLYIDDIPEREIAQAVMSEVSAHLTSSQNHAGASAKKTVTNVMRTWIRIPERHLEFQQAGVRLFQSTPPDLHPVLHWGMLGVAYPFWYQVAAQAGRLLRLQEKFSQAQIQKRMREIYGERSTVKDATRRSLRSMHDWKVLEDTNARGIYSTGMPLKIDDTELIAWLAESTMRAFSCDLLPFQAIHNNPVLFPFQFKPVTAQALVSASPRIDMMRLSLDDSIIFLRATY